MNIQSIIASIMAALAALTGGIGASSIPFVGNIVNEITDDWFDDDRWDDDWDDHDDWDD